MKLSRIFRLPHELDELSKLSQWVAYRLVWNEGKHKYDKLPINPHDGTNAKSNDAGTWGTFSEAIVAVERFNLDGVGFEFADGYCGIDLDDVIFDDGTLKPFALEIVNLMNSYTEYSPSEKGLHILCRLSAPLSEIGSRRRNDEIGLEMYDCGRFFTVTGKIYGEAKSLENRMQEVKKVYEVYLLKNKDKNSNTSSVNVSGTTFQVTYDDILEKMFDSSHGLEIRALFDGDISRYNGDDSRADW